MIIYLIVLFAIMLYGVSSNHNLTDKRKKKYIMFAFGCLILVSMLRDYTVGRDLQSHYYDSFLRVINMDWDNLYLLGYENGYLTFYKIISLFTSNPQWMIAIHSLIVIGITGWFIYRNSEDVVMSTFLFVTTNTWFMYMTMMRQAMAVCVVLIALEILKMKKWKAKRYILFIGIVILAMQFHSTAIIALFMPIFDFIPFKKKQVIISSFAMLASFLLYNQLYRLMSLFSIGKRDYTDFYSSSGEAINIISLYFVFIYILIFIIGVWYLVYHGRVSIETKNKSTIADKNGYSNNFILYMVLALVICRITGLRISIMSRMTYYFVPFMFILLPRALNQIHLSSNKKIIYNGIYLIMTLAFIWLGYKSAAALYGTVPYQFFWEC